MAGKQPGVRGGAALRGGVAALVVLWLASCRSAPTESAAPVVSLRPEPAAAPVGLSASEPADLLPTQVDAAHLSRADGVAAEAVPPRCLADGASRAAWARRLGRRLAGTWFEWTTIEAWGDAMREVGVAYWDQGPIISYGFYGASIGHDYEIDDGDDVSPEGWRARAPRFEYEAGLDASGNYPTKDYEGVQLPAWQPSIVTFGPDGWSQGLPEQESLLSKVLAVSPGNGRLVVVQMQPGGTVKVLPFTFDARATTVPGNHFPYPDRRAFIARLREVGRSLAETSADAFTLAALDRYTSELGFRIHGPPRLIDETFKGRPVPAIAFPHGWEVLPADVGSDGWRVRNTQVDLSRFPREWRLASIDPAGFLLRHDRPSVTVLTRTRWTTTMPDADELTDAVLLVVPGNGRLVEIQMGSQGLVTLRAFP